MISLNNPKQNKAKCTKKKVEKLKSTIEGLILVKRLEMALEYDESKYKRNVTEWLRF